MDERTNVLKSQQVQLGPPAALGPTARSPAGPGAGAARIVAQDAGGLTLELHCECGRRTYVRCEYAAANAAPAAPARPVGARAATEAAKAGGGA